MYLFAPARSKNFLPILVLLLLVVVFFWKFFFRGLVPVPTDITIGMYYPWLDYNWGFPAGVPVKNSILSDVVSVLYPIKTLAMTMVKNGQAPLWNPYMFAGYPLLANFQIGIFNPANLLYLFLPNLTAWSWQVVLQLLLVAFFTFIFLRHLKLNRWACLFGGIVYAFSGFNIMWLEWNAHAWTAAFLPLLLLLTDNYFHHPRILSGLLLSLAVAVQILTGYPQLAIYTYAAMFLLVVWRHKLWQSATLSWFGFLALGLALTGIQLLPAAELLGLSQRQHEILEPETARLSWIGLITLFAPDYFGNHATLNFWGKGNYTINVAYTGVVALVLSSLASIFRRQQFWVKYFFALAVISLLFSLPTPFTAIFSQLKFIGFAAASATRILFIFNFSLAALSAFAFDLMISQKPSWSWSKAAYLPLIILLAFLAATGLGYYYYYSSPELVNGFWSAANLKVGLRNLVLPLLISFASLVLLLVANLSQRLKKLVLIGFFALALAELYRFGWKYTPFSPAEFLYPSTPVIDYVQSQPGPFRVDGGNAIPVNMWLPYGLDSLAGYDAVYPLRAAEYIAAINSGSIQKPQGRHGTTLQYSSRLHDLGNVCYFLAVKTNPQQQPDLNGAPGPDFQLSKLTPVFEDKRVVVFKNTTCLPRAWLAANYQVKSGQQIIDRLIDPSFDPTQTVILESDPDIKLSGRQSDSQITWQQNQPNYQQLQVDTQSDGFLVLADSFYPGWQANVDGQPTPIYRANFNYRAIYLPTGNHQVSFNYQPNSVKMGLQLSLVSLIIFLLLFIYGRFSQAQSSRSGPSRILPKSN